MLWVLRICKIISLFCFSLYCDIQTPDLLLQKNINGTVSGKTPSLFPEERGYGFLYGEFLYMVPNEDGLTYAWTFPEAFPAIGAEFSRRGPLLGGVAHAPHFDWSPGLRFSGGYRFPQTSWELSLGWTYYHNHSKSSSSIPSFSNHTLIASWFPSGYFMGEYMALQAACDFRLNLNCVDLKLARAAFATEAIVIAPFLSIRGAFLHQNIDISYAQGKFFNESGSKTHRVDMHLQNDFNGAGIRPGVSTQWFLTKGLSVYFNGSACFLYGHFSVDEKAEMQSSIDRDLIVAGSSLNQNVFELDLSAGIQWEMFFHNETSRIAISLGYELMDWLNQNQLFHYFFFDKAPGMGTPSQGDLGIQGIQLSSQWDF